MSDQTITPPTTPPDLPPSSPRALTPRARDRSWREPPVRFCWLSTIALLLVALYMFGSRYVEWRAEAALVQSGTPVTAKVYDLSSDRTGSVLPFGERVRVRYELKGVQYDVEGALVDIGQRYLTGDTINLRVDPENPQRWTNRQETTLLAARLIGGYMALLAAAGTAIAAWVTRNHYRAIWRNGILREALVAAHEQATAAPQSVRLRCHVTKGREVVVVLVCVPQNQKVPAVGEKTWLICEEQNWRNAIPLVTYYP